MLRCALSLSICALAMAGVAPAGAATVSSHRPPTTFTDTADEVNTLSVAEDLAGQIVLTDTTTPPVDGDGVDSGCSVAGDVATCPVSSSRSRAGLAG